MPKTINIPESERTILCRGCGKHAVMPLDVVLAEHAENVKLYGEDTTIKETINGISFCMDCS